MDEFDPWVEENESKDQLKLQLMIGLIGIFFVIAASIFGTLYIMTLFYANLREISYWFNFLASISGMTGSTFILVGNIANLKRDGSSLAWVLLCFYAISWVWRYPYVYAIVPWLAGIEEIDLLVSLYLLSYISTYSLKIPALYAWWSIHREVSHKEIYYSFLLLIALNPLLSDVLWSMLFGFGAHSVGSPEEMFILHTPYLFVSLLSAIVQMIFYLTQIGGEQDTTSEASFEFVHY